MAEPPESRFGTWMKFAGGILVAVITAYSVIRAAEKKAPDAGLPTLPSVPTEPILGAQTPPPLAFDFERYAPGDLVGQDGWETVSPGDASPKVTGQAGQREVSCRSVVSSAERPLPATADWILGSGDECVWTMQVYVDGTSVLTAGMASHGPIASDPMGRTVAFGVWAPKNSPAATTTMIDAGGQLYPGETLQPGRWYELRLAITWGDVAMATLSYRIVGGVADDFTVDRVLASVPLWLIDHRDESRRFVRFSHVVLKLASSGQARIDNLSLGMPKKRVPGVLDSKFAREKTAAALSRDQLQVVGVADVSPGWLHFSYYEEMEEKIAAEASIILSSAVDASNPGSSAQRLLGVQLTYSISQIPIGLGTIGRPVSIDTATPVRMAVTALPSMAEYRARQALVSADGRDQSGAPSTPAEGAPETVYFCSFRIEPVTNLTWGDVKTREDLSIHVEASAQ